MAGPGNAIRPPGRKPAARNRGTYVRTVPAPSARTAGTSHGRASTHAPQPSRCATVQHRDHAGRDRAIQGELTGRRCAATCGWKAVRSSMVIESRVMICPSPRFAFGRRRPDPVGQPDGSLSCPLRPTAASGEPATLIPATRPKQVAYAPPTRLAPIRRSASNARRARMTRLRLHAHRPLGRAHLAVSQQAGD
jgi:hypothetical protein